VAGAEPFVFDTTFQQFHSDRTEIMISNGVPPAFGNVCVGVWQPLGRRRIKLHHTTWNWSSVATDITDLSGFAGTFVMDVTLRLDRDRNSFSGTWSAVSFDKDGVEVPGSRFEGIVSGARITVPD
jgi:hypothetical protein